MKDQNQDSPRVVDFNQARAEKLEEKRRKTERIFFHQLMSVYCVVGETKMRPIEVAEVSESGLSFMVPFDAQNPWPNDSEELPLRLYFSQDTFISVHLKVQNANQMIHQGRRYVRYGCSVDKTVSSYPAYAQFVNFLKAYSTHAQKDTGDVTVYYL